ncbi:hypothetical protein [Novosphingobium colocasiae]|uniref:hypothetical protein n=1 Tax=Novosphingobium colocasiae TaxID=1256513 RepID=UPI0035AE4E0E
MSAILKSAVLVALSVSVWAQPGYAETEKAFSSWFVEPPRISSEPVTLKFGDFLQKARLLPIGLIEVTQDIPTGQGDGSVINAGEQFFELMGGTIVRPRPGKAAVFCQLKTFGGPFKNFMRSGSVESRYCLVDRDRDGTIDDIFPALSCPYDIPLVGVILPKGQPVLAGVPYRHLPPEEFRDAPTVGIAFAGVSALDGDPRFIQAFGTGRPIPLFGEKHSRAGKTPGQRISFGAAFTILHVDGPTITIRNDSPIPAQPFGIIATGRCPSR